MSDAPQKTEGRNATEAAPQALKPLAWGLLPAEWKAACSEFRQPVFRAKQIWKWLQQRRVISWDAMTDIPSALRDRLAERYDITAWADDAYEQSADDGVRKLLLGCRDGVRIESVIIPARDQCTVCISTQAGCAFGCAFCATGKCGFERNLETGEIVGQFIAAAAIARGRRICQTTFAALSAPAGPASRMRSTSNCTLVKPLKESIKRTRFLKRF